MSRRYDYDEDEDWYDEETDLLIRTAEAKNRDLVSILQDKRKDFAGIGTNKSKRRLNKLIKSDDIALAVRTALEIEDKNISAKKSHWGYKDKIYFIKQQLIDELCVLFRKNNWTFGIQKNKVYGATHVIYFEIPGCEQISWHFSPGHAETYPKYEKEWDNKVNSTLTKLECVSKKILSENNLI